MKDIKGIIKLIKPKNDTIDTIAKKKKKTLKKKTLYRQTTVYNTLVRKVKTEHQETRPKPWVIAVALEG